MTRSITVKSVAMGTLRAFYSIFIFVCRIAAVVLGALVAMFVFLLGCVMRGWMRD